MSETIEKISKLLPENFESLSAIDKLDELMQVANAVIQPKGNFGLIDLDTTVGDFLGSGLQKTTLFQLFQSQQKIQFAEKKSEPPG